MSENQDSSTEDHLLDQPIANVDQDLLGCGGLAATLANTILAQQNNSALTVGIDGPWGSGKSSILQLLCYELERTSQRNSLQGIGPIIVPFSPWLISNRTALISEFFEQLDKAIDTASRRTRLMNSIRKRQTFRKWRRLRKRSVGKHIRSARKAMSRFAGLTTLASTAASAVDPTLNAAVVANLSGRFGRAIKPGERSLEELKDGLVKSLKQIATADNSFRIVVVVDDLDRLDPEDTLEVLRLVKTVANFPAVTYLLAYDRQALADSISKTALVTDGNAYLEKIIQLSFKVPPLEPFRLRRWLREEIDELFPKQINDGSARVQIVLDVWAGRLLRTPRDVKRLLFSIRAIWPRLESKADLLDLTWLLMVKEKAATPEADLYSWVVRYLQSLDALAIGGRVSGTAGDQRDLVKILKALGWKEYKNEEGMDSIDFHHMDRLLSGISQDSLDETSMETQQWTHQVDAAELGQFREECRLSSPWHWRLYFAFDPPSHAVTDDEWMALKEAAQATAGKLNETLGNLLVLGSSVRRDVADQVLSRIIFDARNGTLKKPVHWLQAAIANAGLLKATSKVEKQFGFDKEFDIRIKVMVMEIFRILSEEDRGEAVHSLFCESADLGLSATILRDQYAASGHGDSIDRDRFYLTGEELNAAVVCQVKHFDLLKPNEMQGLSSPYDVLYAWKEVTGSSEGPEKLLNLACKTDEGLLDTLSALKYVTSSDQNNVPHVPAHFLKNFMDVSAVKFRLDSIAGSGSQHSARAQELLKVWWSGE